MRSYSGQKYFKFYTAPPGCIPVLNCKFVCLILAMYKKHKIAFLYLDEIHHIPHFIGAAASLSKTCKVHILTYPGKHKQLKKARKRVAGKGIKIKKMPTSSFRAMTDRLKGRSRPRKGFWLKKNMDRLLSKYDALIFTDYFQRYVLEARRGDFPKLIKFPHGSPGRAYSFNPVVTHFDAQVVIGPYHYTQLEERDLLGPKPLKVGYLKPEAVQPAPRDAFFKNDKPIVLYNPHFDSRYSSWEKLGIAVLNYFAEQDEYNLIFAPHIHLFDSLKGKQDPAAVVGYMGHENIHIDLGSKLSIDMTYLNAADLYMGDVSSQVYEFIKNPRPTLFLNAHNVDYMGDVHYRFWKSGNVLTDVMQLSTDLKIAFKTHPEYLEAQETLNEANYYNTTDETASHRAARLISSYLDDQKSSRN
jgi:hypothetical protein